MSPADRSSSGPAELGAGGTLLRLWSERWRADPDRSVLVSGEDPAAVLSHQALAELTAGAAAVLAARGVAAGDRVLWCRSPSLDSIVGLLGALRLGAVVVPLNPRSAAGELSYVVGDVRPVAALVASTEHRRWIEAADVSVGVLVPDDFGARRVDGRRGRRRHRRSTRHDPMTTP